MVLVSLHGRDRRDAFPPLIPLPTTPPRAGTAPVDLTPLEALSGCFPALVGVPLSFSSRSFSAAAARERGVPLVGTTLRGIVVLGTVEAELGERGAWEGGGERAEERERAEKRERAAEREREGEVLLLIGERVGVAVGEAQEAEGEAREAEGEVRGEDETRGFVLARKEAVGTLMLPERVGVPLLLRTEGEVELVVEEGRGEMEGGDEVGGGDESSRGGGMERRPDSMSGEGGCERSSFIERSEGEVREPQEEEGARVDGTGVGARTSTEGRVKRV